MPKVNLVPKEERAREYRRQFLIVPIAGAAVIFLVLVGGYIYYQQQLESAEDELQQYQDKNASQENDVELLDTYEAIGLEKQEKQVQVALLDSQRYRWSRTLDDIAFVVPDDIWFKKMEGNVPWLRDVSGGQRTSGQTLEYDFVIEGRTHDNSMPSVAIFMVRLGLIPSLEDVELLYAEKVLEEGQYVIKFEIGANLVLDGVVTQPAIAPSTGEDLPSNGSGTGTGTSTTEPDEENGSSMTGTGTSTSGR